MIAATHHLQACFDAWINCENLLANMAQVRSCTSKKITKIIDECAMICMGTFHAIKSSSQNLSRLALLCVGICEECAELCDTLNEDRFSNCAAICRECADSMSILAFTNLQ